MAEPISTALLIASILGGSAEAIWGGKPSPEEEEYKKRMKYRMEYGLFPHERTEIKGAYTPMFARGRDEAQNRLARIFASRGTSYSSDFPGAVAKIPSIGEQLTKVMMPLEMQARGLGEKGYGEILGELTERRREATEGGIEDMLVGGTKLAQSFMPDLDDELKQAMIDWMQSQPEGTPFDMGAFMKYLSGTGEILPEIGIPKMGNIISESIYPGAY